MKPIKKSRKRKARKLREGKGTQGNTDGSESTHLMEWGEDKNKKGKKVYTVNPTIAPTGKGGKYEPQSYDQAKERGEVFEFKGQRKAEKFSHGSWKQGKDKRDAMKDFRQMKRLLRIKDKAEAAFDAGNIEKAKELAAKANKIEKLQMKEREGKK